MARPREKLSAAAVRSVKQPGLYSDGGGLWLQVSRGATGVNKSWVFRYTRAGRTRDMGLGSFVDLPLARARQKAGEARALLMDDIDPLEAKRTVKVQRRLDAAAEVTFRAAAERYIESHASGWKNSKHAAQWPATLEAYAFPVFGALGVQAIDTGLVLKALEPIWTAKPETASRVRGRIESVLDWAAARGLRGGENPARWRGHLDKLLPRRSKVARVRHHAALPYTELPDFLVKLRLEDGVAARALEFVILTAARTGEAIGATWREIDLREKIWSVPASRMKASRDHRVPLSARASQILKAMQEIAEGEFVFPGGRARRPLSNMAMLQTLRRMGRGDLTVHGFRSTFRDWAAERTGYPAEVAEMALAHTITDKVEAAYRRGDLFSKRRRLMADWAKYASPAVRAEDS